MSAIEAARKRAARQQHPPLSSFRRQMSFYIHGDVKDAGDGDALRLRIDVQDQIVRPDPEDPEIAP
jgi:hypothetical protein